MGTESLWEPHTPVRPEPPPPSPPQLPPPVVRRKWYRRPLVVTGLALLVLCVGGGGLMYLVSERLGDNVTRVQNAFGGLDEADRPPATGALTFLLVGTDSRSENTAAGVEVDGTNSDADVVMVAWVAPDRTNATVVSIPRDSWVDIPTRGSGRVGGAYAAGGPSLLIRTVEKLTDLRIDHFAVIDFAGFRSMVDVVGGIDVDPGPTAGPGPSRIHMDGARALAYVRDPSGIARGERARRQQNALRAIFEKAAAGDTLSDPVRLYDFLDAASHAMGVDDTLSNGGMRAVALKLSGLRPADVQFLRAPIGGLRQGSGGLVMQLDPVRAPELWTALRQGTVAAYLQQNGRDALGAVTR